MRLIVDSPIIREDISSVLATDLPWRKLAGKRILITGASGMLAAYIVETLLRLPECRTDCASPEVIALVRNREKAERRFQCLLDNPHLQIRTDNIIEPLDPQRFAGVNIIIHAAGIPRPDALKPVDVMSSGLIGTWQLLELARKIKSVENFLFFSSGAVYGNNTVQCRSINEDMTFPVALDDSSACYTESKRAGEVLCRAFMTQFGIPVQMLRYFTSYGPGMDLDNDPRSFAAFIGNAVAGEDIRMSSQGEEVRFWCYLSDATDAFFRILLSGEAGEAYNIGNPAERHRILETAEAARRFANSPVAKIVFTGNQKQGYAPYRLVHVNPPGIEKLQTLGFEPKISMEEGFSRSIAAYDA